MIIAAVALLVAASACYPLGITLDRLGSPYKTLDGNAYLARDHPDDFAAIQWLRQNVPDQTVILETTGDPYSYFARFSSNTGLPTVLGWANHEGLWRGHDNTVMERRDACAAHLQRHRPWPRCSRCSIATRCATSSSAISSARSTARASRSSPRWTPVFRSGGTVIYRR